MFDPSPPSSTRTLTLRYSGGEFHGQIRDGQPNGYGVLVYKDDVTYEGWWEDGLEDGEGKLTWQDGTTYTGMFNGGKVIDDKVINYVYEIAQKSRRLTQMMEDMEDVKDDIQHIALTLDLWQSRFDQLYVIAEGAGADPAVLQNIRNGTKMTN